MSESSAVGPFAGEQGGDEQRDITAPVRFWKLEHRATIRVRDDRAAHVQGPVGTADRLDQRQRFRRLGRIELVDGPDHQGER